MKSPWSGRAAAHDSWSRRNFCHVCLLLASPLRAAGAASPPALQFDIVAFERKRILAAAGLLLAKTPRTIRAIRTARNPGGPHDYYSESEDWWPDPANPRGPYVQRVGQRNPGAFNYHRRALQVLSIAVPTLTAAWLVTRRSIYARAATAHLRAWFVDPATAMAPHLKHGQAIRNKVSGRSVGLLDTIPLVEVARAATILSETDGIDRATNRDTRAWFTDYLGWLMKHEFGIAERGTKNHRATCWLMQTAEYARYIGDNRGRSNCSAWFKAVLLPQQLAPDGSFPNELASTEPYAGSAFNLDAMATICQTLSRPEDNLWTFALPDGRGIRSALAFMYPYLVDKRNWRFPRDAKPGNRRLGGEQALLFGGLGLEDSRYVDAWKTLAGKRNGDDGPQSAPAGQPVLWLSGARKGG